MRWNRVLMLLILIVVALASGWMFIRSRKTTSTQPKFTMPDGTRVQLERVTFGTNHTFPGGLPFLSGLRRFVPSPLRRWFGPPISASFNTTDEILVLWYNRYNSATDTYPAPMLDTFRVIDEHGCVFQINQYGGGVNSPGFSVSGAYVPVFPRRQNRFRARAQSLPVTNIEWIVENPYVTNPPAWKPEPLPAVRQSEGVEFTLERLRGHFYANGSWFETKFKITEDGADHTDWYKPRVTYVDATGNRSEFRLCPYEPAWKLEVDFYKSHKAPFPEDALWRVPNVNVPASGEVLMLDQQTNIAGISIKLIALCGSGDFRFAGGVCVASNAWSPTWQGESSSYSSGVTGKPEVTFRQKQPSLLLEIDGLKRREDFLIRFRDDHEHSFAADFSGSAGKSYRYTLNIPKEMRDSWPVNMEFIPQKPVHLEYMAEPPRPRMK
jgi:hypothetical protein